MCIRVGKIAGTDKPTYPGYEQIVVKTKSDRCYWELSPYYLKCPIPEEGKTLGLVECVYYHHKTYRQVREVKEVAKWKLPPIVWEHRAEVHINAYGEITPEYWAWRWKGMTNPYAVRYPNNYNDRSEVKFSLLYNAQTGKYDSLDYIETRKRIYCPLYGEAASIHPRFDELQKKLQQGTNLLILDVDGPRYTDKYPFNRVDKSIEITKETITALLYEPKQALVMVMS